MSNLLQAMFTNPTKAYIEKTLRAKGELKLAAIQHPYADYEAKTWDVQLQEALAYQANPASSVPLLSQLALERGITLEVLVAKVMENANAFRTASGSILGQQQKFLDELKTEIDLKALLNRVVSW